MKLRFGLLFLLLLLLFSACSIERKLAMEFIKQKEIKVTVLIVPPFSLDMYNNNEFDLDSLYIPEDFPLDSVLFYQTNLLKHVSDSTFLENYLNGFINNLRKSGFQVLLPDELDVFHNVVTPAYIFKFAQVELSEETYSHPIIEEIKGTEYHKSFDLNLVTINSWFEFEARDTTWRKVFFTEDAIMDEFEGNIILDDKDSPVLYYRIDSLSIEEIYLMANDAGKKYAGFLTDYLMNNYIDHNFPQDLNPNIIFQYDAELKLLFPYEEGFREITKEK